MKIIWIEKGLRVIDLSEEQRLYECKCFEKDCEETFFVTSSFSCPPTCPSCSKSNVQYVSEHDIDTATIAHI
jgi:hypothetical protein